MGGSVLTRPTVASAGHAPGGSEGAGVSGRFCFSGEGDLGAEVTLS